MADHPELTAPQDVGAVVDVTPKIHPYPSKPSLVRDLELRIVETHAARSFTHKAQRAAALYTAGMTDHGDIAWHMNREGWLPTRARGKHTLVTAEAVTHLLREYVNPGTGAANARRSNEQRRALQHTAKLAEMSLVHAALRVVQEMQCAPEVRDYLTKLLVQRLP